MTQATAVKERPILFSGPMIRAILDGRKTQTRRVVKPLVHESMIRAHTDCHLGRCAYFYSDNRTMQTRECPYGGKEDRLWVREAWYQGVEKLWYKADIEDLSQCGISGWKPSIYMPRAASRITLEVTGVRVERLQDISEEDAKAEGVPINQELPVTINGEQGKAMWFGTGAIDLFARLWDSINAKSHPWESNPWVWVVEFKQV